MMKELLSTKDFRGILYYVDNLSRKLIKIFELFIID